MHQHQKLTIPTRFMKTTRYKGKEIAKPITPPSESASEEDSDPEQAQKDKDMQKNLALIAKVTSRNSTKTNQQQPQKLPLTPETSMWILLEAEKGVIYNREIWIWLADTDEEIDEQELEAHYSYMARIQEVPNADSGTDSEPLEYDTDNNVFANDIQHFGPIDSCCNNMFANGNGMYNNVTPVSPDYVYVIMLLSGWPKKM
ncbi:hypothetical protein Tco_0272303 [Tanacetum coccineum]